MSDAVDLGALALAVDDAVRGVPGVLRLYPADPAVVRSAHQLLADGALAQTSVDDGAALINIAVSGDRITAEVAADVAEVARGVLGPDRVIRVRVSRFAG